MESEMEIKRYSDSDRDRDENFCLSALIILLKVQFEHPRRKNLDYAHEISFSMRVEVFAA